jgi:hypothetical protein
VSRLPPFDFDANPDTLVVGTYEQPGYAQFYVQCNLLTPLRAWGDGRAIAIGRDGIRTGVLSPADLHQLFTDLANGGFFEPQTYEPMPPSGTSFSVRITILAGRYGHYWGGEPAYVAKLIDDTAARLPRPFVPQHALLVAGPPMGLEPVDQLPEWPARFGIALGDVDATLSMGDYWKYGKWISGDTLDFLWQQRHTQAPVGFRAGGRAYAICLLIPGLSARDPGQPPAP